MSNSARKNRQRVLKKMQKRGASLLAIRCMENHWRDERDELFGSLLHAVYMAQLAQLHREDKSWGRLIGECDWVAEIARIRQEIFS
jgi:hypothetical protein